MLTGLLMDFQTVLVIQKEGVCSRLAIPVVPTSSMTHTTLHLTTRPFLMVLFRVKCDTWKCTVLNPFFPVFNPVHRANRSVHF